MKFAQKINVPLKIYFLQKIAQDKKTKKQKQTNKTHFHHELHSKAWKKRNRVLKANNRTIIIKTIEIYFMNRQSYEIANQNKCLLYRNKKADLKS